MNLDSVSVFDIETDGLEATKLHVISYEVAPGEIESGFTLVEASSFMDMPWVKVGHNIQRYDVPTLNRLTGKEFKGLIVDTLALSWYLFPSVSSHGLEAWGDYFKVPKPQIDDWENLTQEQYQHRCETDVKINRKLWDLCLKKLRAIYDTEQEILHCIQYLSYKIECAYEQEEVRWKLDVSRAEAMVESLSKIEEEKTEELRKVMPLVPQYTFKNRPKNTHKQDGTLSAHGERWFNLLKEHKLPMTHKDPVKVKIGEKEPNPGSTPQVKDWLYSLGWKPITFDYKKNEDGTERMIPQVRKDGELCESVKRLKGENPAVEILEGLTVVRHRLSIFKNFLKFQKGGYLKAEIQGFTNTLRFRHANPLVNLPGVDAPYGEDVRGCLIADEGEVLCGADLSSLEATTKAHYIYPYDQEYAKELTKEGFDEHLDLAVTSGELPKEDYVYYTTATKEDDRFHRIHKVRKSYKPVNYSAVYGVGKKKLAREMDTSEKEAKGLLDVYWERNWAVREVAKAQKVKTLRNGEMWVLNPVSSLYLNLRYEKDIFSTLNQSTGVYVFDTWVKYCRSRGVRMCGQFHDEFITRLTKGEEEKTEKILTEALDKTNQEIKLHVNVGMEAKFGNTYADVH